LASLFSPKARWIPPGFFWVSLNGGSGGPDPPAPSIQGLAGKNHVGLVEYFDERPADVPKYQATLDWAKAQGQPVVDDPWAGTTEPASTP
jgi:hypothetical protein